MTNHALSKTLIDFKPVDFLVLTGLLIWLVTGSLSASTDPYAVDRVIPNDFTGSLYSAGDFQNTGTSFTFSDLPIGDELELDFTARRFGLANWAEGVSFENFSGAAVTDQLELSLQNFTLSASDYAEFELKLNEVVYGLTFTLFGFDDFDSATISAFNGGSPVTISATATTADIESLTQGYVSASDVTITQVGATLEIVAGAGNAADDAKTVEFVKFVFPPSVGVDTVVIGKVGKTASSSDPVTLRVADAGATPKDIGDASSGYGEASHTIQSSKLAYLGVLDADGDPTSQKNIAATADDNDGRLDEDGVTFSVMAGDSSVLIASLVVNNATTPLQDVTVCGWLDSNTNGTYEVGELSVEEQCEIVSSTTATVTFDWAVNGSTNADYYSRYRICPNDNQCDATGNAGGGEAEDYLVSYDPTSVSIGAIELFNSELSTVFSTLGLDQMTTHELSHLLSVWVPELAQTIDRNDKNDLMHALRDYLDPDGDGSVALLHWETLEELGTNGFYAERRIEGEAHSVRVNTQLLPALGDAASGGAYWLADPQAKSGTVYHYLLIEQETWGKQVIYGPYQLELTGQVNPNFN